MIERLILADILRALDEAPAVCLLGPRQAGKTTLALEISRLRSSIYLDLESDEDRVKLTDPAAYLATHLDKLVILDEVHRMPELFAALLGLVDQARRQGAGVGRYLLLGSASLAVLRQGSESLAGRMRLVDLSPFNILEPTGRPLDALWLRGGFPNSLLASNDGESLRWRRDFIRTYLERDVPMFGPRAPAETLRRFWVMLAHRQGAPFNQAELARSLESDVKTVRRYLDLLVDLLLVRRLAPWRANLGKRLVKRPRIFFRDSGLTHALLGIGDMESLVSHPVAGASWEGFAIEQILSLAPPEIQAYFYRSSGGAEIDLLLEYPGGARWAVEIKRSRSPRVERGFHSACADVKPERKLIAYAGPERFPLGDGVEVVPIGQLAHMIRAG